MDSSRYVDSELFLSARDQARLSVVGREYLGRPTLDEALERRLLEVDLEPTQYGALLFKALFPSGDDLLTGFRESLTIARREGKRLRLRLHVAATAPPELHDLQWELLYDPGRKLALARSQEIAFSRYLGVAFEARVAVAGRPRLLVVISCPRDLADYDLPSPSRSAMRESLEQALAPLSDCMTWELLDPPVTLKRLRDRLVAGKFHALHLIAHGLLPPTEAAARLVLETGDGRADFVDEEVFSEAIAGLQDLRLVSLIACHSGALASRDPFSGLGPALIHRGMPAVLAMRRQISFDSAARFAEHFFRNLARSGRVDVAANEARLQLYLGESDSQEWGTPALFMRLVEGRLWTRADAADLSTDEATPEIHPRAESLPLTDLRNLSTDRPYKERLGKRWLLPIVAILLLTLALVALLSISHRLPESRGPLKEEQARLAFLGFEHSDATWMAVALTELLHLELKDTGHFRLASQRDIARMKSDSSLPEGESVYQQPESLAQIKPSDGVDLIAVGTFEMSGAEPQDEIEIVVHLRDMEKGRINRSALRGKPEEILDLLPQLTAGFNNFLGMKPTGGGQAPRRARPLRPNASKLLARGLEELTLQDYRAAHALFQQALEIEPASPVISAAMADVLWGLGREQKAVALAELALRQSRDLSRKESLPFLVRLFEMRRQWQRAAAISMISWRVARPPETQEKLTRGLRLALLQAKARWGAEALATLDALRELDVTNNPRFSLIEAEVSRRTSRYDRQFESAQRAAAQAGHRDAPFLLARARYLEGEALSYLGDFEAAEAAFQAAQEIYVEQEDVQGQAHTHLLMGNVQWGQQDFSATKTHWDAAASLYASIGNRRMEARVLMNKGLVVQEQGHLEAAADLFRESLARIREAGDRDAQIFTAIALAENQQKRGHLSDAETTYADALELDKKMGIGRHEAYLLRMRGALLGQQGKLSEARHHLEEALRRHRQSEDNRGHALASFELAIVLYAQGDLTAATRTYQSLLRLYEKTGVETQYARTCSRLSDVLLATGDLEGAQRYLDRALEIQDRSAGREEAARTGLAQSRLLIARERFEEAVTSARVAVADFARARSRLEEARARSTLALAQLSAKRLSEARQEVATARQLLRDVESPVYRLPVELVSARIKMAAGKHVEARTELEAVLASAIAGGFVELELETRLSLGALDLLSGSAVAGIARLQDVEREAENRGYTLLARKASKLRTVT